MVSEIPESSPMSRRVEFLIERRLWHLREMYANDEITLDEHGRYAELVLQGEQPEHTETGLPILPDPALEQVVFL